jgi:hypothetical protein
MRGKLTSAGLLSVCVSTYSPERGSCHVVYRHTKISEGSDYFVAEKWRGYLTNCRNDFRAYLHAPCLAVDVPTSAFCWRCSNDNRL